MNILIVFLLLNIIEYSSPFTPNRVVLTLLSRNLDDSTHGSITEDAFQTILNEYNPSHCPLGCILDLVNYQLALKEIVVANWNVDFGPLGNRADYHFDAERFEDTNNNIILLREWVIGNITQKNYPQARESFGTALHPLQDFYSHSNWVEMGITEPSTRLGVMADLEYNTADPDQRTCQSCPHPTGECKNNVIAMGVLTSGYYFGLFPQPKPEIDGNGSVVEKPVGVGKCSHGGPWDNTTNEDAIGGINKDTSDYQNSPHGHLHKEAARLAQLTTQRFIRDLWKEIGDEEFAKFLQLCRTPSVLGIPGRRRRSSASQIGIAQNITIFTNPIDLDGRLVQLLSALFKFNQTPLIIPIDITLHKFVISISIPHNTIQTMANISLLSPTGVQYETKLVLKPGVPIYIKIESPQQGLWKFGTEGTGGTEIEVIISGISEWDCIITLMSQIERMRHISKPGLIVLDDKNALQVGSILFVHVMTPVKRVNVTKLELMDLNGNVISSVPSGEQSIKHEFARELFEITVPEKDFRIVVHGEDKSGFEAVRMAKSTYNVIAEKSTKDLKTASQNLDQGNHEMILCSGAAFPIFAIIFGTMATVIFVAILGVLLVKIALVLCGWKKNEYGKK